MADLHVPIRAGSDIAFLGGLIRHVLETESYFKEYVLALHERRDDPATSDFEDAEDLGGYFSGCDPETQHLRPDHVAVRGRRGRGAGRPPRAQRRRSFERAAPAPGCGRPRSERDVDAPAPALRASTSCAATTRATRRRWSSASAASPQEDFHARGRGADRATRAASAPPRSATRVGWTQHTAGVQMIRAAAILQLLLGNIGRPGRRHHGACAATRRSRARPTSRRSTTCCPATCRCRKAREERARPRDLRRHGSGAERRAGGRTSTSTSSRC